MLSPGGASGVPQRLAVTASIATAVLDDGLVLDDPVVDRDKLQAMRREGG